MTIDDAKELVAGLQPLLLATFLFRDGVAQATATLADGAVSSISIDEGGTDYLAPPTVDILGDGSGATAEATIVDGVVTGVTVTEGGTGYTFAYVAFGDVLLLSTKDVTYNGQHYQGRLDTIDLEAVQMMSESGVDIPPSLTLHIADADASILLNWENGNGRGFKGSKVTLTLVFYDVLSGTFSTDSLIRYQGIADPATPSDEQQLEVRTTNRLNAGKKQLPTELIQSHCFKIRPRTAKQCAQADDPASPYYPCGITDPEKPDCKYTREGCLAADNLARFAGVTFAPPRDGGKGREYTSGQWVQLFNSSNDAKYGQPWPVVLGRGWVEAPVLNVRQSANDTRMDVGLTVGHIDTGKDSTVGMTVVVNGYPLPPGGYDSDTGWHALDPGNVAVWNWKARGWRDGNAASDTDPYGSCAVIECVVPRAIAGGESVPQVSVLFTGPLPGAQFQDAVLEPPFKRIRNITVVDGLVTVFFTGVNNEVAGNDPAYEITIEGNSYSDINGTWTHLINWDYGRPNGSVQFNAAVADGSGTGGTLTYPAVTPGDDNPAWHLYDLLRRSGWRPEEIDYPSFVIAAEICTENIEYSSTYGGTGTHARYKSAIVLRQRRPASEIIRGVRTNFGALLQPNRDSGRLSVLVKGPLAAQQPAAQPGSNYNDAIVSQLRNGTPSNGYVAYHFTEDTAISVHGIARPISDTPNRLAFQFQDSENNFAQTSLALVESEDVERVGQELPSTVQIEGCATTDQATRLTKGMQREAHRGNPLGDTRGTRWYEIKTSIRAIRVGLGQIAMVTWPKLGLDAQLVRVMGVKGPAKNGVISLNVAIHADEWYVDSLLQSDATGYSNPKRDKLARASFPACPDIVGPRAGDPFLDVTDKTFALVPVYDVSADGTVLAKMRLRSKIAVNEFGAAHPPQIATQTSVSGTGGTLRSGLYYVALSARDGNGKLSAPSLVASAHIPVGVTTGSIPIVVQWWHPDTAGYEVFAGRTPFSLSHQASGDGTPLDTPITLTSYKVRSWGLPDQELDALIAMGKVVRHSGITGTQVVLDVAANTLTISGDWSDLDLAGYGVSVVAKVDNSELPVLNYTISANATTSGGLTELTVSPDPVADGLAIWDVIVIRSKPVITNGGRTLTDAAWQNPLENNGGGLAPAEEVGMVCRILYGTGQGLTNTVASATATSHTMARNWLVTPDSTSRMIIEEPTWLPLDVPIRPLSNSDPTTVLMPTFPVENYSRRTMLIGLATEDGGEHRSVEALMPVREIYVFGAPETTHTITAADSPYSLKWSDMNLLVDTTAGAVTINLAGYKQYPGRPLVIKKISDDANGVLIQPSGDEEIDGQTSWALSDQWESLHVKSNV